MLTQSERLCARGTFSSHKLSVIQVHYETRKIKSRVCTLDSFLIVLDGAMKHSPCHSPSYSFPALPSGQWYPSKLVPQPRPSEDPACGRADGPAQPLDCDCWAGARWIIRLRARPEY